MHRQTILDYYYHLKPILTLLFFLKSVVPQTYRANWYWCSSDLTHFSFSAPLQKPLRYRRAISYDSKEYYVRLLSGNPGMYQHSVEHNTEGETTQHEPEHGEDTIARVKGEETITREAD